MSRFLTATANFPLWAWIRGSIRPARLADPLLVEAGSSQAAAGLHKEANNHDEQEQQATCRRVREGHRAHEIEWQVVNP